MYEKLAGIKINGKICFCFVVFVIIVFSFHGLIIVESTNGCCTTQRTQMMDTPGKEIHFYNY